MELGFRDKNSNQKYKRENILIILPFEIYEAPNSFEIRCFFITRKTGDFELMLNPKYALRYLLRAETSSIMRTSSSFYAHRDGDHACASKKNC